MGQEGEFRQVGKGQITNRWRILQLGQYTLTSNYLDKRVCAHVAPPKRCVYLGMVPPPYSMLVNGVELGSGKAFVMDANSEADFVSPDETECLAFRIPKTVFEAGARSLFPGMPMNGGLCRILEGSSSAWSALHGDIREVLRDGSLSAEDISRLTCRFLGLMAGESEKSRREALPDNRTIGRIARRAREYIEEHYPYTIRMEDLCRSLGVSLRTLQRSFSEYFQVSPSAYIKARRLHAARKALMAGESSRSSVTGIALDNGFTHLGRFSVEYREHFGESPHETLRR